MKTFLLKINEQVFGSEQEQFLCKLPEDRQRKTRQYRRDQDQLLSFWTGMLIRNEFGDERIVYGQFGKPGFSNEDNLFFSVSHAWPYVFFAISECNVGIDIEKKESGKTKLAKRFFTGNERRLIDRSDDPDETFFKIWTGKEAYFKMKGTGLTVPLNSVDVIEQNEQGCLMWDTLDSYILSVCSEKPGFHINLSVLETDGICILSQTKPLDSIRNSLRKVYDQEDNQYAHPHLRLSIRSDRDPSPSGRTDGTTVLSIHPSIS